MVNMQSKNSLSRTTSNMCKIKIIKKTIFYGIFILINIFFTGCGLSNSSPSQQNNNENILLITDIHFDPFNSCGTTVTQASSQCVSSLINQSDPTLWSFPLLQSNIYSQETNNGFLVNGLNGLASTISNKNITKIFITGDLLSHQFPNQFASYIQNGNQQQLTSLALNTINYVLYKISQAAPNAKIYYIFGNNDTDQADYSYPTQQFMQQITPLISKYMADQAAFSSTFSNGGYFNMKLNSFVNVIGLNFNPLTMENINNTQDYLIAQQQLVWLSKQLEDARNNNKKIIVLHHEPFGMNAFNISSNASPSTSLQPEIANQYLKILNSYSDVITNFYYGHYHMETIETVNNTLALSTLGFSVDFDNNPGFKILEINNFGQLQNYTTYYANFTTPNFNWQKLYDLNSAYNIAPTNYVNFFATQLQPTNNPLWQNYVNYYSGNNTNNVTVSQMPIIANTNWNIFYCSISNLNQNDFNNCVAQKQ